MIEASQRMQKLKFERREKGSKDPKGEEMKGLQEQEEVVEIGKKIMANEQ